MDEPRPTLLQQREIEARVLAPFVAALSARFGEDAVLDVLRKVIVELAHEAGRALADEVSARQTGDQSPNLADFASALERWQAGGAMELALIESAEDRLSFDVTRCRYAEMYRNLGIPELGKTLSCGRDHALIGGFSEAFGLERSQTLLGGAGCCDFRFRRKERDPNSANPPGPLSV